MYHVQFYYKERFTYMLLNSGFGVFRPIYVYAMYRYDSVVRKHPDDQSLTRIIEHNITVSRRPLPRQCSPEDTLGDESASVR